jgi:hypothetical protein
MPASPRDVLLSQRLGLQIVDAGLGRVQRVVMIGSRALGTARADSDLDLVVLVELPAEARPWGPAEVIAERRRMQEQIGTPPVLTDLWVRTTDRYEEARGVIGGVERLVDTEGVTVYARPTQRPPVVRRSPDEVRREHVSAWVEHALAAYVGTLRMESGSAPPTPGQPKTAQDGARICAERAVNALLVYHQREASKSAGVDGMLALLPESDHRRAIRWAQTGGRGGGSASGCARRVMAGLLERMCEDRTMRNYVSAAEQRFRQASVPTPQR